MTDYGSKQAGINKTKTKKAVAQAALALQLFGF